MNNVSRDEMLRVDLGERSYDIALGYGRWGELGDAVAVPAFP